MDSSLQMLVNIIVIMLTYLSIVYIVNGLRVLRGPPILPYGLRRVTWGSTVTEVKNSHIGGK